MRRLALHMIVIAAVLAAVVVPAGSRAADGDLGRALARSCGSCHGAAGIASEPGIPHLAGQNAPYLVNQLRQLRRSAETAAGTADAPAGEARHLLRNMRQNPLMHRALGGLSDRDIDAIAAFYTGLACRLAVPVSPPPAPRLAARCEVCHGPGGVTDQGAVPRLAGQDAAYLIQQLRSFQAAATGMAGAAAEDRHARIMESQARYLAGDDVGRLADYFAAQPCR